MKYERYESIYYSENYMEFEFISKGPKGEILKMVQFTETENNRIYNLAFGNKKNDGKLDDYSVNNNKDRNKIIATVADIIALFTTHHPDKYVIFIGSDMTRNRLYRMAINLNLSELKSNFEIYGLLIKKSKWITEEFEANKEYEGFLIKRK